MKAQSYFGGCLYYREKSDLFDKICMNTHKVGVESIGKTIDNKKSYDFYTIG